MLSHAGSYLAAFAIIFGLNLLPVFSPPAWAVIAFIALNFELAPAPLVPIAAVAATGGRVVLALGSRSARGWLSERRLASLAAAHDVLARSPKRLWGTIAFFFISPVPSSPLFIAAGVLNLPIRNLSIAFFCGRLITYTLYLSGAEMVKESAGDVLLGALKSPLGIALQLTMVLLLGALFAVDWVRVFGRVASTRRGE